MINMERGINFNDKKISIINLAYKNWRDLNACNYIHMYY